MTVHSLSVPSYTTKWRPLPQLFYLILLEDTTSATPIPIYRDYPTIATLHEQLLKEFPTAPPPYPLPPKITKPPSTKGPGVNDSTSKPPTTAAKVQHRLTFTKSRTSVEEQRAGFERYLRGLVQGKIGIWRESKAWTGFIAETAKQPTVKVATKKQPVEAIAKQQPVQLSTKQQPVEVAANQEAVSKVAVRQQQVHKAAAKAVPPPTDELHKPVKVQNISPYKGANSYYLHTLPDNDRQQILSTLSAAGFTVVRIFINGVGANNKGSGNAAMNDVEVGSVGNWDDAVLEAIDSMMVECKTYGIKLIIALHDRYSLGFWEVDVYATTYGVVAAGTTGAPQVADASAFYNSTAAQGAFDNRIRHILSHQNAKMNNTPWSQLGEVIFAIEPENESQGHMTLANPTWANDRAGTVKTALGSNPSGIKVSNGGGVDVTTSTASWAFGSNFDIVCVHDYGTTPWSTLPTISSANGQAMGMGKTLLFEEWGALGASKASIISNYVQACGDYNIPWCYWEVVIPGAGAANYEVWTTEPSWAALNSVSVA